MTRPADPDARSAVRRVVQLLDALAGDDDELSIRELAARTGIPRSSVHRFAGELAAEGLVTRGPGGLTLGMRLFAYGAVPSRTLREAAAPLLRAVAESTALTVNLAVRDGDNVLYLDKVVARGTHVPHARAGGRGALHATALGKALLAFSDTSADVPQFTTDMLTELTEHTITSRGRIEAELRLVRREGVAFDAEESHPGLFCVAAPIRDRAGAAVAAISITGATALAQATRFRMTVVSAARAVERRLAQRRRSRTRS